MGTISNFINSLKNEANDGKNFEKFCVWFLTNDDYWKTQVEKVWLWNEWPDRWGPDCGIDLIFKHKNGGIWAVQAKCYDESTTITKADMDSFLSVSNRKKKVIACSSHRQTHCQEMPFVHAKDKKNQSRFF